MVAALPPRSEIQRASAEFGRALGTGSLRESFAQAGDFGLLRAHLDPELDGVALADIWEGAGETGPAGVLFAMAAHAFAMASPVAAHGSDEVRSSILPKLLDGTLVGAHAASEAGAGSDTMAMQTRAERDGADWRLSGSKLWVSNGADADLFVVFAQVEGEGPAAFLVEGGAAGLEIGAPMEKMGLEGSTLTSLYLDAVRVASDRMLEGGSLVFHTAMLHERALIFAPQVGAMRAQLERSLKHARTRRQFGRPIGKNQLVAARVVDMFERYILGRGLLRDTATALAGGSLTAPMACLTKLRLSEWALEQHLDAIRIHGGSGFVRDTGLPAALAPATVSRGQSIQCQAKALGTSESDWTLSPPALVVNAVPSLSSVAVAPASPTGASTLSCLAEGWQDADGDLPVITWAWLVDDELVPGAVAPTLPPVGKGHSVRCQATPGDGLAQGAPRVSAPVQVLNAAPSLESVSIVPAAPLTAALCRVTGESPPAVAREDPHRHIDGNARVPAAIILFYGMTSVGTLIAPAARTLCPPLREHAQRCCCYSPGSRMPSVHCRVRHTTPGADLRDLVCSSRRPSLGLEMAAAFKRGHRVLRGGLSPSRPAIRRGQGPAGGAAAEAGRGWPGASAATPTRPPRGGPANTRCFVPPQATTPPPAPDRGWEPPAAAGDRPTH